MRSTLVLALALFSTAGAHATAQLNAPPPCPEHKVFNPSTNTLDEVDCHSKVLASRHITRVQASAPETESSSETASSSDPREDKARVDYNIWVYDFNRKLYEDQNRYSFFIFLVVNALVLAGLYFAWIQFKTTLHLSERIKANPAAVDPDSPVQPVASTPTPIEAPVLPSDSEFKFGKDGVAIRSSFIGLIILGFSMAFYLMYLKYVYTIHSVDSPSSTLSHSSPGKENQPASP